MEGRAAVSSTWVRMWVRPCRPLPEPTAPPSHQDAASILQTPQSAPAAGSSSLPRSPSLYILDAPAAARASASWCLSNLPEAQGEEAGDAAEAPVVRGSAGQGGTRGCLGDAEPPRGRR